MRKNIAFLLSFLVMTAPLLLPVQAVAAEDCTLDELLTDDLTDVPDAADVAAGHDTVELPENVELFEDPADVQDEASALLFADFQELDGSLSYPPFAHAKEKGDVS